MRDTFFTRTRRRRHAITIDSVSRESGAVQCAWCGYRVEQPVIEHGVVPYDEICGRRRLKVANILPVTGQPFVGSVMVKIRFVAADKIVDDPDLESAVQQQVHHVAADETGPTRHYCAWHDQAALSFFRVRTL